MEFKSYPDNYTGFVQRWLSSDFSPEDQEFLIKKTNEIIVDLEHDGTDKKRDEVRNKCEEILKLFTETINKKPLVEEDIHHEIKSELDPVLSSVANLFSIINNNISNEQLPILKELHKILPLYIQQSLEKSIYNQDYKIRNVKQIENINQSTMNVSSREQDKKIMEDIYKSMLLEDPEYHDFVKAWFIDDINIPEIINEINKLEEYLYDNSETLKEENADNHLREKCLELVKLLAKPEAFQALADKIPSSEPEIIKNLYMSFYKLSYTSGLITEYKYFLDGSYKYLVRDKDIKISLCDQMYRNLLKAKNIGLQIKDEENIGNSISEQAISSLREKVKIPFITQVFSTELAGDELIHQTKEFVGVLKQLEQVEKKDVLQKECEQILQQFSVANPDKFNSKIKSMDLDNLIDLQKNFDLLFRVIDQNISEVNRKVFTNVKSGLGREFINIISLHFPRGSYLSSYLDPEMKALQLKWNKFSNHIDEKKSILWMVEIQSDGFGDLSNCLNAIKVARKEYPDWNHKLVIHNHHYNELHFDFKKEGFSENELVMFPYYMHNDYSSTQLFMISAENLNSKKSNLPPKYDELDIIQHSGCDRDNVSNTLAKKEKIDQFFTFLESSDLQISISTKLTLLESVKNFEATMPNYVSFAEYGGPWHKCDYNMGLSRNGCGIFILDPVINETFTNPILNECFKKNEKVFLNYGDDAMSYIKLINNLYPDLPEINIICKANSISTFFDYRGCREYFADHFKGISKIISRKNGEEEIKIEIDRPGKIVYLIDGFPFPQPDIIKAMHLSQEPVGVTGNCTFSEALNRLPFYNNRDILMPFWSGLIDLCDTSCPNSKKLSYYLRQMSFVDTYPPKDINITSEDLPVLKQQWAEFVAILKKDWDVSKAYIGEINYRLAK